jgi:hypothetical protein
MGIPYPILESLILKEVVSYPKVSSFGKEGSSSEKIEKSQCCEFHWRRLRIILMHIKDCIAYEFLYPSSTTLMDWIDKKWTLKYMIRFYSTCISVIYI